MLKINSCWLKSDENSIGASWFYVFKLHCKNVDTQTVRLHITRTITNVHAG